MYDHLAIQLNQQNQSLLPSVGLQHMIIKHHDISSIDHYMRLLQSSKIQKQKHKDLPHIFILMVLSIS